MGREASCECQWADEAGVCKVLLETHELLVRGPLNHRVLLASMTDVSVQGGKLHFRAGEDSVVLTLGPDLAESWAKKMVIPPPSLATKLGISRETRLALIGKFEGEEVNAAIAQAAASDARHPSLMLASVKTAADLDYTLDCYASYPGKPPLWICYPKGPNKPLGEGAIRDTLRREGFIDTKVASVSATLTALRFIQRT